MAKEQEVKKEAKDNVDEEREEIIRKMPFTD